jgi:hypothetical protein
MTTTMTARFPGKCASCGGRISVGSSILWAKGEGARHADCSTATAAAPAKRASGISELRNGRWVTISRRELRAAVRGDDSRRIGEDDDTAGYHGQDRAGRTY